MSIILALEKYLGGFSVFGLPATLLQSKQPIDDGDFDQVVLFDYKMYFHAEHCLQSLYHVSQMTN